jgi:hypothetical protein
MPGDYAGGWLTALIPPAVLLASFALMMFATTIAIFRGRRGAADRADPRPDPWRHRHTRGRPRLPYPLGWLGCGRGKVAAVSGVALSFVV